MRTPVTQRVLSAAAAIFLLWRPALPAVPSEWGDEVKYGKTRVADYEIPAATLKKWGAFKPSKKDPSESAMMNALLASTENWSSPSLSVRSDTNPYVIVLKLKGRPVEDGNVTTMWQGGWLDEGVTKSTLIPSLSRVRVKAGETLLLAGASGPSRFKENRDIGVSIGLVNANNWQFDAAKVEVWSGLADASWTDVVLSLQGAMVGVVLLGIMLWFRRR